MKNSRDIYKALIANVLVSPDTLADVQRDAVSDVKTALENLLKRYCDLVNCGDCGNWNPEDEKWVIDARNALKEVAPLFDHLLPFDPCISVPPEIRQKANEIDEYFSQRGINNWELEGIKSR